MKKISPQSQVFWFLPKTEKPRPCVGTIKADVAIVGGGMAGLTAAQEFVKRGLKVALLEQYTCGSGASGKSSGFITPDAELDLEHLSRRFGIEKAHTIWQLVGSGVTHIQDTIKKYGLSCEYKEQDTIILANGAGGVKDIKREYATREKSGYKSILYSQESLQSVVASTGYLGGIRYGGTFGMRAAAYCQELKKVLESQGVQIYEEAPVISLHAHHVTTPNATIEAQHIVVCADWAIPELGRLKQEIYHVQTFLMLSAPLSDRQVRSLFPQEPLMAWDTDLIYQYFRLTSDNRLLLGGCTWWDSFASREKYYAPSVAKMLTKYFNKKFPEIQPQFDYMWPGLIGVTKDLLGIVGPDPKEPSIYYVGGVTGLPWAAALGAYSAQNIVDKRTDMDDVFSPTRSFPIGGLLTRLIGKRAAFGLSDLITVKFK